MLIFNKTFSCGVDCGPLANINQYEQVPSWTQGVLNRGGKISVGIHIQTHIHRHKWQRQTQADTEGNREIQRDTIKVSHIETQKGHKQIQTERYATIPIETGTNRYDRTQTDTGRRTQTNRRKQTQTDINTD